MYQQHILDHYHNPRHKGRLATPDFASGQYNPSCGDSIAMQGCITDGTLAEVAFEGSGCVLSQACASLIAQHCLSLPVEDILAKDSEFIQGLLQISVGPTRLKCALLPLHALQNGIISFKEGRRCSITRNC